jgi:hypothetical protein
MLSECEYACGRSVGGCGVDGVCKRERMFCLAGGWGGGGRGRPPTSEIPSEFASTALLQKSSRRRTEHS